MVIFHSYVNLPEGRVYKHYGINNIRDYGDDVQNVQIPGLQRRSETKKTVIWRCPKKKARNTSYSMVINGVIIP